MEGQDRSRQAEWQASHLRASWVSARTGCPTSGSYVTQLAWRPSTQFLPCTTNLQLGVSLIPGSCRFTRPSSLTGEHYPTGQGLDWADRLTLPTASTDVRIHNRLFRWVCFNSKCCTDLTQLLSVFRRANRNNPNISSLDQKSAVEAKHCFVGVAPPCKFLDPRFSSARACLLPTTSFLNPRLSIVPLSVGSA